MKPIDLIPKHLLIDFDTLKVGDTVWTIQDEEAVITSTTNGLPYPIMTNYACYTETGKTYFNDSVPSMFKSNPFLNLSQERVIEVLNEKKWILRVLYEIGFDGVAWCWKEATTIKDSKFSYSLQAWQQWREVKHGTITELTMQDISDGKGVGIPPHLIRIKE